MVPAFLSVVKNFILFQIKIVLCHPELVSGSKSRRKRDPETSSG